ncbi:hypothetical protein B0H13DRAFT_2653633 [Mycena leptocephala]|nr:hypothetical protein B0H13DRAFT_2653633 [Mycena leptocephala]
MSLGQIIHRILHSIDAQVEHESENISPFSAEIRDAAGGLHTTATDTLNFLANILPIHIRLNRSVFNAAARLVTVILLSHRSTGGSNAPVTVNGRAITSAGACWTQALSVLTTKHGLGCGGPLIRGDEVLASGVAPDPIPSGLRHTAAPLTTLQASLAPVPTDTIMGHPTQNFAWANQMASCFLKTTSLCPPYQCHKDLLGDFSARLHYFIDTQAYRSHMGFPALQVIFDFSGEYSIVAADYDIASRKVAVNARVDAIEDSVASVTGLTFSPRSFYVRPDSVITRLCCFKILHPLPATYAPTLVPQNMLSELEIFVLANVSHRYFPAEKTIVRYRLFG